MRRTGILRSSVLTICLVLLIQATILATGPWNNGIGDKKEKGPPVAAFKEEGETGKYGFIDRFGNVVLAPKYESAGDFDKGLAWVRLGDKKGYINERGIFVANPPPGTESSRQFTEGRMWVKLHQVSRWALYDANGNAIILPEYDDARPFSDGMAAVNHGATPTPHGWGHLSGGKWGFVNLQGELVIPIKYEHVRSFSEGLALVHDGKKWKYLDKTGKTVVEIENGDPGDFSEGLAPIREDLSVQGQDRHTRFIDTKGKTVFVVDGYAEEFHDGMAILTRRNNRDTESRVYGYIDRQGNVVIRPTFMEASEFSEGLAAVRLNKKEGSHLSANDTWGYIDKTGKLRVEPIYNAAHPFSGGVACVHFGGKLTFANSHQPPYLEGGEWWLIDINGKKLKRHY